MVKTEQKVGDYVSPLDINGMSGRMLRLPAIGSNKREILFIYGHHSSLERWWGVIAALGDYGTVTVPDLPGFGGMDSFYKIGKKPTIDNLADYLATFVKLRYKRKRISIVGLSFGFVIVTRMLQNYPELAKKVDLVVSFVGFAHKDDFTFTNTRRRFYLYTSIIGSRRLPAFFCQHILLQPWILRLVYARLNNSKTKFDDKSRAERRLTMRVEEHLWRINDVRTQWATVNQFLRLDNCQKQINLPIWHIDVAADRYFDAHRVEQHLRIIFSDFHGFSAKATTHAPSVIVDKKSAAQFIPLKIRQLLAEQA